MTRPVTAGWLPPEYVGMFIEHLADWVGYRFGLLDWSAFEAMLPGTDSERPDGWFEYPLAGTPALTVRAAREVDADLVTLEVTGSIDPILTARIETAFALLCDLPNNRWPRPLDM